jgi:hypothetical protein
MFKPIDLTNPDFLFDVIISHQRRLEVLEHNGGAIPETEPDLQDLCARCGKPYGHHTTHTNSCWDQKGRFTNEKAKQESTSCATSANLTGRSPT